MYNIDAFVNTNSYNYELAVVAAYDEDLFEAFLARFVLDNNIQYDVVNQDADPVFVYELQGQPVAWYDCENQVGFVAK